MKRLCWNRKVFGVTRQRPLGPLGITVDADAWLCINIHMAEALGLVVEIWKAMVTGSQVCFPPSPLSTEFLSCGHFIAKERGRAA